jgi:hypothetical protein
MLEHPDGPGVPSSAKQIAKALDAVDKPKHPRTSPSLCIVVWWKAHLSHLILIPQTYCQHHCKSLWIWIFVEP